MAVSGSEFKEISNKDIAVRCPVCGDSQIHRHEKRLHLYEKNNETRVGCFNGDCPVGQRNVWTFLRDFYPDLFIAYKREKFRENLNSFQSFTKAAQNTNEAVDVFAGLTQSKKPLQKRNEDETTVPNAIKIVSQDFSKYFTKLDKVASAMSYVSCRGYQYNATDFGSWYHANIDLTIGDRKYMLHDYLLIPLYTADLQMYGFYSRSLKDKKFYTYMNPANIGYKVWNYFNIDCNKTCYITEGIFDAISLWKFGFKNVIASMGAKISDEVLKTLKDPVFCLDNDKTGKFNALNAAKDGHKVLIYPKQIRHKDLNEMLLNNIDLHNLIQNNVASGIMAQIKLRGQM